MKKVSKVLSLVIGLAICFVSLCTPALAASKTPEEEAAYLQSIIAEVDQFVYINESNMFALKDLPDKYSDLYPEMKKSIDETNELIKQLIPLGNFTVNKDDKSFSSKFLGNTFGNDLEILYWWGSRVTMSSESCERMIKGFESSTWVVPYYEKFINKLRKIQYFCATKATYDMCHFNIHDNYDNNDIDGLDVWWCFLTNTLIPCK